MIDQTGTATPSTETPEAASAAEAHPDTTEPTEEAASDKGAAQADLDRVTEPNPAAAPDVVGEVPPDVEPPPAELPAEMPLEGAAAPSEPAVATAATPADTTAETAEPAVEDTQPEQAAEPAPAITVAAPVVAGPRTVGRLVADVL